MKIDQQLIQYWDEEIRPRFSRRALDVKVRLLNGEKVRYVNLDNAATTIPFKEVIKKSALEFILYGSVHRGAGFKSKWSTDRYEEARESIREFVNGKPESEGHYVNFVPNTTVGMNNLAYYFANIAGKVLVSDIEHSSSSLPWVIQEGYKRTNEQVDKERIRNGNARDLREIVQQRGKEQVITYRTRDDFTFDLDDIDRTLREQKEKGSQEEIKVLVVTGASNVTGYKPPLKGLAELAHKYGAWIVVDGCQLLQHERIDMQEADLDFVVFSGHKMYASFGSGAIIGDRRVLDLMPPRDVGGGNLPYINADGRVVWEKNNITHDPGTPNFVGARAIHHAIQELKSIGLDKIAQYEHALVEYAFTELGKINGVVVYNGRNPDGSFDRGLLTFNIKGLPHKLVAEVLNTEYGIGTRAGAYCVYEFSRRVNHTTKEKDTVISKEVEQGKTANIPGSVRASFAMYNSIEDVDRLATALKEIARNGMNDYDKKYFKSPKTGDWSPRK